MKEKKRESLRPSASAAWGEGGNQQGKRGEGGVPTPCHKKREGDRAAKPEPVWRLSSAFWGGKCEGRRKGFSF